MECLITANNSFKAVITGYFAVANFKLVSVLFYGLKLAKTAKNLKGMLMGHLKSHF